MSKGKRVRHHVNPLADRTEHCFKGFDNKNPVIIDIGADRGEFIDGLRQQFGGTKNFIVFEIRKPLAERLRIQFKQYDNVVVFNGDVIRNFESIVKSSIDNYVCIEEIYINFPDPWFKEKHKKRRVINDKFIKEVQMWIQPETKWIFQTDQKPLFEETTEMLQNIDDIKIGFFDTPPYEVTTKWEDAKVASGDTIYRLSFHIL